MSGGVVGEPAREAGVEAGIGVIVHVEVGVEVAGDWAGGEAGLIGEVLVLWLAVLHALHGGGVGIEVGRACGVALFGEWVGVTHQADDDAGVVLGEVAEGAGVDAEEVSGVCVGQVGAGADAGAVVGVLVIGAAVEHAYLANGLGGVVGRTLLHAEHVLRVAEVIRTGAGS